MTGNEYAAETDWSKEQDKGKVSKGRNTKCQNRSIQISSLNDTREKILPEWDLARSRVFGVFSQQTFDFEFDLSDPDERERVGPVFPPTSSSPRPRTLCGGGGNNKL